MINDIDKLFFKYYGTPSAYPRYEKIIELIDKIRKLDLAKCQIPYIRHLLDQLLHFYTQKLAEVYVGVPIYRGIIYSDKPLHVSQLSYPPVEYAKINRASKNGQQMFYSATNPITPLYELGVKVGDRLVLSTWKVRKKLKCNSVGYTKENFQRMNSSRENFPMPDNNNPANPNNIIIHQFLSDTFSQIVPKDKPELYFLTIAIAESMFDDPMFDGFIYPTIPMNANADNIVFKPSVIDSGGVQFDKVTYNEITRYDPKNKSYSCKRLDFAQEILPNGSIKWIGAFKGINL